MRVCVCERRPIVQFLLCFTSSHYHHRAGKGELGNLHAQAHTERPWGLGTGATSKPALCLSQKLRMNRERKEMETDSGERKEWYDSEKERGDVVTPRYENRTERLGRMRRWIQARGDTGTPEDKDSKENRRKRRDVRKIDGLTQRTDREITVRQGEAVKPQRMVAVEGKRGIKGINVAVMVIIIIAADISMASRNSSVF